MSSACINLDSLAVLAAILCSANHSPQWSERRWVTKAESVTLEVKLLRR